jgi:hypothetical protein
MKYKIEKNTVQETLVIPLFARKVCSELYPNLYRDETAVRLIDQIDYDFSEAEKNSRILPFCYQHPDYWNIISEESKRTGNMIASRKLFDDSEAAHPITEEEFIRVENIRGKLFLVGAEDDALWDTANYIRRMEKRLAEKPHSCEVEAVVYEHGTHFVFPDGMLKTMLPAGSALFVKLAFSAAKKYPRECKTARIDIDRRMTRVICDWRDKK